MYNITYLKEYLRFIYEYNERGKRVSARLPVVEKIKKIPKAFKSYALNNLLVMVFIFSSVFNAFLLRAFTVKFEYNQIKPLLADIALVLFWTVFSYLFKKPKKQFIYLMIFSCIFVVLCVSNSIYFTNYKSFISVSLLIASLS